jgi:hypothetical protein
MRQLLFLSKHSASFFAAWPFKHLRAKFATMSSSKSLCIGEAVTLGFMGVFKVESKAVPGRTPSLQRAYLFNCNHEFLCLADDSRRGK